jgi:hypothetical protein
MEASMTAVVLKRKCPAQNELCLACFSAMSNVGMLTGLAALKAG